MKNYASISTGAAAETVPKPRRTRAAHAPHQAFRHELPSAYFSSRHAHARTRFATFRNSEVSLLNFLWIYRASLSLTQPLNSPANASRNLQLHSPIIRCASLSLTQPLDSPANASSALQLHSPIIRCASLSLTQPLNSPANASSALQLHSPIIYRTLLSLTQPLNSPANASSALQLHFPIELRTPKNPWKAMPQSRRGPPPQPRRTCAATAPQPRRTCAAPSVPTQPTVSLLLFASRTCAHTLRNFS